MFFDKNSEAWLHARLETMRTKVKHVVKPCYKYVCRPNEEDCIQTRKGYTLVLKNK